MEFASHSTNSHNITGMACKFAKVFKLKSIGVFFSHTNTTNQEKSHSFATAPTLSDSDGGGHDSNEFCQEVGRDHKCNNMAFDIDDVFEAISALKLTYVRLQNAHLPYDPLEITAADKCIVMQLEKLLQMKPSFDKIREIKQAESDSCEVVHVNLQVLDDLESEITARESQIVRLKRETQDLRLSNAKMIEKLASGNKEWSNGVGLFEDVYGGVSNAIRYFTKLMIMLMRDSGWDLDRAANSIEKSVVYSKRSHMKYAFQAFVARRMFYGFSTQSYHRNDSFDHSLMRFEDPINALMDDPSSSFADYCISKYLLLIHPKLEESIFRNLHHRDMISKGKHPRTTFYQAFAKMARWVWLLRRIPALVKPKPQIFGVQRRTKFSGAYMDSIDVTTTELASSCNQLQVELMVMPGFRIGNSLVKCKAYASTIKH